MQNLAQFFYTGAKDSVQVPMLTDKHSSPPNHFPNPIKTFGFFFF